MACWYYCDYGTTAATRIEDFNESCGTVYVTYDPPAIPKEPEWKLLRAEAALSYHGFLESLNVFRLPAAESIASPMPRRHLRPLVRAPPVDTKTCEWCDGEFQRRLDVGANHWRVQRFCSRGCAVQWSAAHRHQNGRYHREGQNTAGLPEPLDLEPGSETKILELIARAERRQELFHPDEPRYEVQRVRLHVASSYRSRRIDDD